MQTPSKTPAQSAQCAPSSTSYRRLDACSASTPARRCQQPGLQAARRAPKPEPRRTAATFPAQPAVAPASSNPSPRVQPAHFSHERCPVSVTWALSPAGKLRVCLTVEKHERSRIRKRIRASLARAQIKVFQVSLNSCHGLSGASSFLYSWCLWVGC